MKTWDTVAIVGVGLIGGSIGLALRERELAKNIIGVSRRAATLRAAKRRGAVTRTTADLPSAVADAELIVVCTPVETIVSSVRNAAMHCPQGAMITDVGSTKEEIVSSVEHALLNQNPNGAAFIGSHPMAGSEKTGPQHARADLFEGCVTIVTPSPRSSAKATTAISRFWKSLGSTVIQLAPKEHDQAVAAISHLPHLVASALAAATPANSIPLAAGGWRDTTRVAAGDAHLWRQILSQNRFNVLHSLDKFMHLLGEYRRALTYNDRDMLEGLLEQGKAIREPVNNKPRKTPASNRKRDRGSKS